MAWKFDKSFGVVSLELVDISLSFGITKPFKSNHFSQSTSFHPSGHWSTLLSKIFSQSFDRFLTGSVSSRFEDSFVFLGGKLLKLNLEKGHFCWDVWFVFFFGGFSRSIQ